MPDKSELYRTSDLYFGAYLCALDVRLETTEEDHSKGHKKVIFVFRIPNRESISRLKSAYFGGTGTVRVRVFVDRLKSLKEMCFT